jgi:outer membrane immunogenic protein
MLSTRKISKLALCISAIALSSAAQNPALAGDYGSGSPSWSGLYLGAGIGAAWGDSSYVFTNGSPAVPNPIDFDTSWAGGVFGGIQHQWGNFVLGVETGILVTDLNGSSSCPNPAFTCSAEVDWIWTIGPRLGFAFSSLHVYGTGGYALGSVSSNAVNVTGSDPVEDRNGGWYAGGGVEWQFKPNMILGVEYRHIELDTERHDSVRFPGSDDRNVDATVDTIQARLTVKLGRDEPMPAPLK